MMCADVSRRLDSIVAQELSVTRSQARSLIMEGRVRLNGNPAHKAGQSVRPGTRVEVERPRRFVSRGGEKLEAALAAFALDVRGVAALDIGASTGGFTDCLLARGAAEVTALDVGYGQLDWRLRNDPRVQVIERTNVRLLPDDAFPQGFDLIVVDASFISLRTVLERAVTYLRCDGCIVALVKPQFEVGRARLGRGGVVRDPSLHRRVLMELRDAMPALGLRAVGLVASPLLGPAGNREFFLLLRRSGSAFEDARIAELVPEAQEHP
ncbi:MAG: TlyA family RNA methyltransferase [Bacillati bacterium]